MYVANENSTRFLPEKGSSTDFGFSEAFRVSATTMMMGHKSSKMTMTKTLFALVALAFSSGTANAAGAVDLTKENFAEAIKGKNAFVKFLAVRRLYRCHCICC